MKTREFMMCVHHVLSATRVQGAQKRRLRHVKRFIGLENASYATTTTTVADALGLQLAALCLVTTLDSHESDLPPHSAGVLLFLSK